MGNDTSKPPQSYSRNVPLNKKQVVHESEFLQTYTGRPSGGEITMGPGQEMMSIGLKILRSVDDSKDYQGDHYGPGELYVIQPSGRRVYLTKGGVQKSNADRLAATGRGYGVGPAVLVGGGVGAPTYTLFSSTSTAPGSSYTAMTVNNAEDFRKAVWFGHENEHKGKYSSRYGSAAINPFQDRPRNAFSTLADVGRGALKVLDVVAIPIIEFGLDEVTGGIAGTALQVSGMDDLLQKGLDQLTEMHGLDFSSTSSKAAPYMSNIISDPRLASQYDLLMKRSRDIADNKDFSTNKYQKELQRIVNSRHEGNVGKMFAVHKLEEMNLRFSAQQQIDVLAKTVAILKKKVPNPPNISWDLIQQGLDNASDPRMQVEFAETTTQNLIKRVVPFMQKQQQSVPTQPVSTGQATKKPEKPSPDPTQKQGSGFINGGRRRDLHPTEIRGFIPSFEPLSAF